MLTAASRRPARSFAVLRRLVAALAVAGAALAAGPVAAAPVRAHVHVYFLRGEQLAAVSRPGSTAQDAVRALVAGPTAAERARGFRSDVPNVRIHGVSVGAGVAAVDLGARFTASSDPQALLARLAQLVRTLTGIQGARGVQLLIDGQVAPARFPGISTGRPITYRYLQTPNIPLPKTEAPLKLPPPDEGVKSLQQRLVELGYLLPGDDDGQFGPGTSNALLAFQKWEGLRRTGLLDAVTQARLDVAEHPTPRTRGPLGKRAEILIDRQVALLIRDNQVVRTIAVSSGKPSTPTPPGNYRVYAKITRWWSVPFREWLPYAIPFVGGIAFHEFGTVPPYPASHGCVRQSYTVARWTYAFATVGMPVRVIAKS